MNADLLAAAFHAEPTEANMVRLLDEWSLKRETSRLEGAGVGA